MGSKAKKTRNTIPYGIFQFVSTIWLTKLLLRIKKNGDMAEEDIPLYPEELEISSIEKRFKSYFEHVCDENPQSRPKLLTHLIRTWLKELLLCTAGMIGVSLCNFLFPILVQQLILYFEDSDPKTLSFQNGFIILALITLCQAGIIGIPSFFTLFDRCEITTISYLQYECIRKYDRLSPKSHKV
jgi:hypothetical protein